MILEGSGHKIAYEFATLEVEPRQSLSWEPLHVDPPMRVSRTGHGSEALGAIGPLYKRLADPR